MPTVTAAIAVSADDGAYTAATMDTTRGAESWVNGNQFLRFQSVAVPVPRRCIVDSATLSLTGAILSTASPTVAWTAQRGNSLAITSGADATARTKTTASVSYTFTAGLLGAVYTVPITPVIAEAVGAATWTVGGSITLFGVRTATGLGLTPMSYYTSDSGALTSAGQKPILTIVWHPAGDSTPGAPVITGVRTGRKNARGGAAGPLRTTAGVRTGRKNGMGRGTGTARLTGVMAGRTGRKGAVTGGPSLASSTAAGRAGRRGGTAGRIGVMGVSPTARPARRGPALLGSVKLAGQALGRTARRGAVLGAVRLTGDRAGRKSTGGRLTGVSGLAGVLTGRPAHLGATGGVFSTRHAARGSTSRAGSVSGRVSVTGAVTGIARHSGAVTGRAALSHTATASAHRTGRLVGAVGLHGWVTDADSRFGVLEGHAQVSGRVAGISGRAGGATGSPAIAGHMRGLAGRAGGAFPGLTPSVAVTTAGQPAHSSSVRGVCRTPRAGLYTGLAGRSGEVHGGASLLDEGAGTLTGQTGRRGVSVCATGAPSGLAAGSAGKTQPGPAGAWGVSGGENGRAGRASTIRGAAATSGTVTGTRRAAGRLSAHFSITGRILASRSGAAQVRGRAVIEGAVRGTRAAGGRVSAVVATIVGNLAAATARQGSCTGDLPAPVTVGGATGRRGGQGAATPGTISLAGQIAAPLDRRGRVAGRAALRGRYTGTRAAPQEVAHAVYRVPAPIVIPTVPATVTRTNPIVVVAPAPAYRAPVPIVAKPQVAATVTAKQPKRGVITRG